MKTARFVLTLLVPSLAAPLQSAKAADVICYNCPPEWADWASMLKAIKTDLTYDIPHDNKNSGQALAQILAEKSNPVGDIGYFGVTFGMKAKTQDALEPYKPAKWEQIAPGLKDAAQLREPSFKVEPPAFHLHSWFSGEGFGSVVTHQVAIGSFDGPHPFFGPDGKLL